MQQQLSTPPQGQRDGSRARIVLSPVLYAQPEERLGELSLEDEELAPFVLTDEPNTLGEKDSDVGSDDLEQDALELEGDEGVSMPGVTHSVVHLLARRYTTPGFANALLDLLHKDLQVPGWADLAPEIDGSALAIHKVSGALTNAVFFVSAPEPGEDGPPTVLVRIYGPSSDSLISRRTELHVLHTLSNRYGIGPAVLGTFGNGRVEQYFRSRALNKDEMRQPRIIKWIARRMRELHSVPAEQMRLPESSTSSEPSRPGLQPTLHRNPSSSSLVSSSSQSSAFSFNSSYSTSSVSSNRSVGAPATPAVGPNRPGFSESSAPKKRKSNTNIFNDTLGPANAAGFRSHSRPKTRERLGVWDNIARWTSEASRVLKAVEKLRAMVDERRQRRRHFTNGDAAEPVLGDVKPLDTPAALLAFKDDFDIRGFEKLIKSYRSFVSKWEKANGKSKRVLGHNDAQYGNLLIRLAGDTRPETPAQEVPIEAHLTNAHEMIIVVDFEYASLNPRGYDIANHFIEWQADYHHASRSHSLSCHLGPPSLPQRRVFYRAYSGIDNGLSSNEVDLPPYEAEDQRIIRLEAEVAIWEGASHASWALWAIVQGRDAILERVEKWLKDAEEGETAVTTPTEQRNSDALSGLHRTKSGELRDADGRLQLDADDQVGQEADFDYLSYASERMKMFRGSCRRHGVS